MGRVRTTLERAVSKMAFRAQFLLFPQGVPSLAYISMPWRYSLDLMITVLMKLERAHAANALKELKTINLDPLILSVYFLRYDLIFNATNTEDPVARK